MKGFGKFEKKSTKGERERGFKGTKNHQRKRENMDKSVNKFKNLV